MMRLKSMHYLLFWDGWGGGGCVGGEWKKRWEDTGSGGLGFKAESLQASCRRSRSVWERGVITLTYSRLDVG